jgi:probable addiction module antidote protein
MTEVVMALETFPYDSADSLTTPEAIVYFLEAELEENDPSFWSGAIASVAKARGGGEQLAQETAIPVEDLLRAADGTVTPNRETLVKVMEAFRLRMSSDSQVA